MFWEQSADCTCWSITAPVLRVKIRQVQTRKCGIQPCSNWKDDLWEVWRTPERKPCCDKVHSIVSIIPSPGPHRCKDFHCCTVLCTQARWDVRVTLFDCIHVWHLFWRAKGHNNEKKKKKKPSSPKGPVFSTAYYFENWFWIFCLPYRVGLQWILPPRDQRLH